jgi:hypothetical protein
MPAMFRLMAVVISCQFSWQGAGKEMFIFFGVSQIYIKSDLISQKTKQVRISTAGKLQFFRILPEK